MVRVGIGYWSAKMLGTSLYWVRVVWHSEIQKYIKAPSECPAILLKVANIPHIMHITIRNLGKKEHITLDGFLSL